MFTPSASLLTRQVGCGRCRSLDHQLHHPAYIVSAIIAAINRTMTSRTALLSTGFSYFVTTDSSSVVDGRLDLLILNHLKIITNVKTDVRSVKANISTPSNNPLLMPQILPRMK